MEQSNKRKNTKRYGGVMEKIFPIILMILDILAGIVYFCNGDIKKGLYWLFAFGLTYTVTF